MKRRFLRDGVDSFKSDVLRHVFVKNIDRQEWQLRFVPMRTDGGWSDDDWALYRTILSSGKKEHEVLTRELFTHGTRVDYFKEVRQKVPKSDRHRYVLFLDPDTGIQTPWGTASASRVKIEEIALLTELESVEAVAVYQHKYNVKQSGGLRGIQYLEDALERSGQAGRCGYFGGSTSVLFASKDAKVTDAIRQDLKVFAGSMADDRVR